MSETKDKTKDKLPDTRIGGPKGISPGRPKGVKNKSTLLREALNNNFEAQLEKQFHAVVGVVIEQALDGCRQSQKLLLDRVIPTVHAVGDNEDKNKFRGGVTVIVGSLEDSKSVRVSEDITDIEYEDISDG